MQWRVFYSYSHKDTDLRDRLGIHLAPLRFQNKITEWYDRKIEPGSDWEQEISKNMDLADLFLFLVSPDFLASEYCFGIEVERALSRLKENTTRIVPVLLKKMSVAELRFSNLQFIPEGKPISAWPSTDEAFAAVAVDVQVIVSQAPPSAHRPKSKADAPKQFDLSMELVLTQIRSYARLYERVRQRMRPSDDRT